MDTNYVISADGMIITYEEWLEMRKAEMDRWSIRKGKGPTAFTFSFYSWRYWENVSNLE